MLVCLSIFASANSQVQMPVIKPCTTADIYSSDTCTTEWIGPQYDTVKMNSTQYVTFPCDTALACEFIVQYYDRLVFCGPDSTKHLMAYHIQLVLLATTDSCLSCLEDNRELLIKEMVLKKNQEMADGFQQYWDTFSLINQVFLKGRCYRPLLGTFCDELYCCHKVTVISYDSLGRIIPDSFIYRDPELYDTSGVNVVCPTECIPGGLPTCDYVPIYNENLGCADIPCNDGAWSEDLAMDIQFFPDICKDTLGIPNCTLKVTYQERISFCDNINYKDFHVKDIEYSDPECSTCVFFEEWGTNQIVQHVIEKLIRSGSLPLPPLDSCENHWRYILAGCWKEYYNNFTPCDEKYCCWTRYRVCNDNGNISILPIDSITNYLVFCLDSTCRAICGEFPYRKPLDFEYPDYCSVFNVRYQSKSNSIEIIIKNQPKGDYEFKIFNLTGYLQLSINFKSESSNFYKTIDNIGLSSGVYLFTLKGSNGTVITNKFIIIR